MNKVDTMTTGIKKRIVISFTVLLLGFITSNLFAQEDFWHLIRQVQINSQRTYDKINSAAFTGHTTSYVYFGYKPFGVNIVPFKEEAYFEGFWIKPDSLRFVVKALQVITPD